MKIDAWSMTDIGLVRKSNQDSVGCFPELNLFVVADGMGGHADGEIASRLAVEVIHDCLADEPAVPAPPPPRGFKAWIDRLLGRSSNANNPPPAEFAPERLDAAVTRANERIFDTWQANEAKGEARPMGTTVVVLKITPRRAHWVHVGDSRLYRVRDGNLELLTADHTAYGEPYYDQATIPTDLPHTNKLLQAVGIRLDINITRSSGEVRPGDLYFLCSDGVSGLLAPSVILEQLTANHSLEEVGRNLIRRSMEGGGKDNASLVVVRIEDGNGDADRTVP